MAKRKRLTPSPALTEPVPPGLETKSGYPFGVAPKPRAPIAQVAGDAAAQSALDALADEMRTARSTGRLVQTLALSEITEDYMIRDRMVQDADEMDSLKASLAARGQQAPIEVIDLGADGFGLISGWRRLQALRALHAETGEARFATVEALIKPLEGVSESYLAMVEENEIRVGLSYFERARIVVKAVEEGVFETDRTALQTLFQSASRAKRPKIGSFLGVVRALDGVLRFPAALTESQGLHLARALAEEDGLADTLRNALQATAVTSPEAETALLAKTVAPPPPAPLPTADKGTRVVGGVQMHYEAGRLILEGRAVNDALRARLVTWLRQNN